MAIKTSWSAGDVLTAADLTDTFAAKSDNAKVQNAQTGDYNFALTDASAGKLVVANKATAIAFTLLQDSAMGSAWPANSIISVMNIGAGTLTLTAGTGVTINANATLAQYKGGMLVRSAANTWTLVPFSGGVDWAAVTGTTGSPTTGTYTENGVLYQYWKWTGAGSMTCTAGKLEVLVVGGGGGAGNNVNGGAWGGAPGDVIYGIHTFTAATHTVTVGNGGLSAQTTPAATVGQASVLGPISARPGGVSCGAVQAPTFTSTITGASVNYGGAANPPAANTGGGSSSQANAPAAGIVVMRRPA